MNSKSIKDKKNVYKLMYEDIGFMSNIKWIIAAISGAWALILALATTKIVDSGELDLLAFALLIISIGFIIGSVFFFMSYTKAYRLNIPFEKLEEIDKDLEKNAIYLEDGVPVAITADKFYLTYRCSIFIIDRKDVKNAWVKTDYSKATLYPRKELHMTTKNGAEHVVPLLRIHSEEVYERNKEFESALFNLKPIEDEVYVDKENNTYKTNPELVKTQAQKRKEAGEEPVIFVEE